MSEKVNRKAEEDKSFMGFIRKYPFTSDMYECVNAVFGKYATFDGRAGRKEYWYYRLFIWAVMLLLHTLGSMFRISWLTFILINLFSLGTIVPTYAVMARRLHDIGMSGWKALVNLVPVAGFIIMIVWTIREGDEEENMYGPVPLDPGHAETSGFSSRELYEECQERDY